MKNGASRYILFAVTFLVLELAITWALYMAPPDAKQGNIQRIFYFHISNAWVSFLAFFYVLYASIRYLRTRDRVWDRKALASGEVGLAFVTVVLVTGPIWAKPTWGVWWAWDAKLTSALVLWLIFLGYTRLRDYIDEEDKRARISAVLGIVGACVVPFVYMSNRWFETQHPKPVIAGEEGDGIFDAQMQMALWLSMGAFTLLYILLSGKGAEIFHLENRIKNAEARITELEDE